MSRIAHPTPLDVPHAIALQTAWAIYEDRLQNMSISVARRSEIAMGLKHAMAGFVCGGAVDSRIVYLALLLAPVEGITAGDAHSVFAWAACALDHRVDVLSTVCELGDAQAVLKMLEITEVSDEGQKRW